MKIEECFVFGAMFFCFGVQFWVCIFDFIEAG
jgi:hypothetical protein